MIIFILDNHKVNRHIEEANSDYTIYKYYICPTFDFQQEILSQGSDLEVLSPEWFRKNIYEELKKQFQNMNGKIITDELL